MKDDLRLRLTQSVETAVALAEGLVVDRPASRADEQSARHVLGAFACPEHGVSLPELQPRIFSFNSPHGACPRCTGLGAQQEIDPDLLVPDPSLSIDEGALVPWAVGGSSFYESVIQAIADRYEIPTDVPWQRARPSAAELLPRAAPAATRCTSPTATGWGGGAPTRSPSRASSPRSQRRYRETDSSIQRERIEEYMSFRPCPVCKGARLKPEVLAVTVGERNIHQFTQLSVAAALALPRRARR